MACQEGEQGWGGLGEESNSLFEGMVLFAPDPDDDDPTHGHADVIPTPSPIAAPSQQEQEQQQGGGQEPLDEDLFSDLTLLPHQDHTTLHTAPTPPLPLPPVSGQTSPSLRKKKRAVRIGYARSTEQPHHPNHLPQNHSPSRTTADPPPPHPAAAATPNQQQQQYENEQEEDAVAVGAEPSGEANSLSHHQPHPTDKEGAANAFAPIEERLALIRSHISRKLDSIQQRAASVAARRKQLGARRRKVAEDVSSASSRHKDLERELEEACEAEDFERAERISESLLAQEKDKDRLLIALRDAEVDYDSVDVEMQGVLDSRIAAEEEGAALLEQLAKDASDYADTVSKQTEEMSSKEIEGWQTSMELLEIKKLEMEVETQLVLAACSGLEGSIEHLVEDDKREKDMLMKKGDTLAEELAGLLELVRLKEAEIAENDARIQEVEERISTVVSEFHGSQSDIDLKLNNLQAAQSKMDLENEALVVKKKEIDELISLTEQKNSKLREIASICSSEAKACKDSVGIRRNLASSILKSRHDRVLLLNMEEKILADIQMLRLQITDARTSLQEVSSRRAGVQQEMALFKQRLSFIDKRSPELEAEKKVAAAARNFKEAGRIAAEAKALNVEKEELHTKWEKAAIDLEKIEKETAATTDKIQECEELVLLEEKESAMTSYKRLRLVSAAARAEGTAAIETGDSEDGEILLKEVEAAESKARELKECYDLQPEEDENMFQPVLSIAFITNLTGQHLAEIAASFNSSSQN